MQGSDMRKSSISPIELIGFEVMIRENSQTAEKSGKNDIPPRGAGPASRHQIVGNNAQQQAQRVEDVPALFPHDDCDPGIR